MGIILSDNNRIKSLTFPKVSESILIQGGHRGGVASIAFSPTREIIAVGY